MIHCATSGASCLYWAVDESHHVMASSKKENASKFYVKPSDNPKHPDEFYICYYDTDISELRNKDTSYQFDGTKEFVEPIPRYLMTPTDAFGRNSGPLKLKYQMRSRDSRLSLVSCIRKRHQPPVSLSEWMSGREMCFIQCARRKHMKGYIAVVENLYGQYDTCCVHSKHNEDESMSFMLFQTVRTLETKTDKVVKATTQADEIDCDFPLQIPITAYRVPVSSMPMKFHPELEPVPRLLSVQALLPPQPTKEPPAMKSPPPPLPPKSSADLLLQVEATDTYDESDYYDSIHSCSDTSEH